MKYLEKVGKAVQETFQINRRVLSFNEYLSLVEENPGCHARSAAQYVRDMFDHYGTEKVAHPEGEIRRFKLFDAPWDDGEGKLIGQEEAQNSIYRIICNFARQGRVNKFILLHGPNGSSKSTITEMISRAMEHYSSLDEGALYRFNWIFPTQDMSRSGIGFGGKKQSARADKSYAYLEDEVIDARLFCEMRDHPLLLLPQEEREQMLKEMFDAKPPGKASDFQISDYLIKGNLCPKCKLIYEALLTSCQGDLMRVLQHVQVERFYISRRYRFASSRVEPQLAVDANARQVTADRSLTALPTALQNMSLFEYDGDLVQANRGVIDYSDLLKRPLEAFKYLLTTVEDSRVVLDQTNLFFDMIFVGSSNDAHLNAFMESPDWMSFRGRMELVQVPYLLQHSLERTIYTSQIAGGQIGKHLSPYAMDVAALWATLTRMHKPLLDRYEVGLRELVGTLTPLQKAELYESSHIPSQIKGEDIKILLAGITSIWSEKDSEIMYEGRTGASPREIMTAIRNAAQSRKSGCLSPGTIKEELKNLVQETSFYSYLQMEAKDGYYDHKGFIDVVEQWYLDRIDDDVQAAMGLVDEASYDELFSRYVNHVIHFVRKEKITNSVTGAHEEPDSVLMSEVEKELGIEGNSGEFRQSLLTKVGAWSIDNSGEKPKYATIFPDHFEKLRDNYFEKHKRLITLILMDSLQIMVGEGAGLSAENVKQAQKMIDKLKDERGYCDHCVKEGVTELVRQRYS